MAGLVWPQVLWLGINDIDTEGDWVAEDHTTLSYFNWGVSNCCGAEPNNNGGNEDAVTFYGGNDANGEAHKWNDSPVTQIHKVVCTYRP